jgi:Flp pilus assembly protein TadG
MRRLSDQSGSAAVEFAILGPVLSFAILAMVNVWSFASAVLEARSALESGATYVLQGGSDPATAQSLSLAQWSGKPADASVTASKSCLCASAAAQCSLLCSDGSAPLTVISLHATGTWQAPYSPGSLLDSVAISQSRTIRIR